MFPFEEQKRALPSSISFLYSPLKTFLGYSSLSFLPVNILPVINSHLIFERTDEFSFISISIIEIHNSLSTPRIFYKLSFISISITPIINPLPMYISLHVLSLMFISFFFSTYSIHDAKTMPISISPLSLIFSNFVIFFPFHF